MIIKFKYILLFFCVPIFFVAGLPEADAQSKLVENIKRRLFRKNKARKAGKRLYGLGERPPLEDFVITGGKEVIGFEPSWLISPEGMRPMFDEHYYNLLTGLAVGGYDIHPKTGQSRNEKEFKLPEQITVKAKGKLKNPNIIQFAREKNPEIKILLPLVCYGDFGGHPTISNDIYDEFFRNKATQDVLFQNLETYLVHLRDTFNIPEEKLGLVLDFDRIYLADRGAFIDGIALFINNLKAKFEDTEFLIYCKIDPVIPTEAYLSRKIIQEIEPLIDLFIIRGYGFEKYSEITDKKPGPLADIFPAKDTLAVGLDSTVNYYARNGIAREKMIIEYPYYGVAWERNLETDEYKIREQSPYVSVKKIKDDFSSVSEMIEQSYRYNNKDSTYTYFAPSINEDIETNENIATTYYFDNYVTLDFKYSWTEDTAKLKGIAIQGLGYNDPKDKDNWYVIANYYAKRKPSLGWLIASFLIAFIPVSFIYAVIYYWEVRNALAKYKKYYGRWRTGLVITSVVSIICFIPELRSTIGMIIGAIILAIFAIYIMMRRYMTKMRRYTKYVTK